MGGREKVSEELPPPEGVQCLSGAEMTRRSLSVFHLSLALSLCASIHHPPTPAYKMPEMRADFFNVMQSL